MLLGPDMLGRLQPAFRARIVYRDWRRAAENAGFRSRMTRSGKWRGTGQHPRQPASRHAVHDREAPASHARLHRRTRPSAALDTPTHLASMVARQLRMVVGLRRFDTCTGHAPLKEPLE